MIFNGKRSGMIHKFTTDADTGYTYIEKISTGVQGYKKESKDFTSNINFKLKKKVEI